MAKNNAVPAMAGMPRNFLTEREAARSLNVSVRTLQRWRHEGSGPAFHKLGRVVRYRSSDLEAYIKESRSWPIKTEATAAGGPVRILSELDWCYRHGSDQIQEGRLQAATNTDYLCFYCPNCGTVLGGGVGLGLEGVKLDPASREPNCLSLRLACITCGFRDFFKLPVKESGKYRTPKAGDPSEWYSPGRKGTA